MFKRIYIEITNQCNLNCTFCKHNSRTPYYMSIDEFTHIVKQIKEYTRYIYLHVQGEPLMHPKLKELIYIAKENHLNIQLVTNGTLIDKCNYLLEGNIRKISFSLHSIGQQTIEPDLYYKNIVDFCKKASKDDLFYCELRFNNYENMDDKSKYLHDKLLSEFTLDKTSKKNSFKVMNKVFVSYDNFFEWPSLDNKFISDTGYCLGGKDMISILSSGQVSACCLDSNGDINLGNIFNSSLNEILKSEKYNKLVSGFKEKKAVEPLCKHCSYRLRFD